MKQSMTELASLSCQDWPTFFSLQCTKGSQLSRPKKKKGSQLSLLSPPHHPLGSLSPHITHLGHPLQLLLEFSMNNKLT